LNVANHPIFYLIYFFSFCKHSDFSPARPQTTWPCLNISRLSSNKVAGVGNKESFPVGSDRK